MELNFSNFNETYVGIHLQLHDIMESNQVPLHTHDFYEILIVVSGSIVHVVNDTEQFLNIGDMVFVRRNDKHQFKKSFNTSVVNIAFTEKVLNGLALLLNEDRFETLVNSQNPVVKKLGNAEMNSLISEIKNTFALASNSCDWEFELKNILYKLFCYGISEQKENNYPNWLNDLIFQMENPDNFTQGNKRIFEIANKTPEHVSRQLKLYLNLTPTEYINILRINYAKNQLIVTNNTIIDICYNVGYDNLNYFYRLFKAHVGISPLKYRNSVKTIIV